MRNVFKLSANLVVLFNLAGSAWISLASTSARAGYITRYERSAIQDDNLHDNNPISTNENQQNLRGLYGSRSPGGSRGPRSWKSPKGSSKSWKSGSKGPKSSKSSKSRTKYPLHGGSKSPRSGGSSKRPYSGQAGSKSPKGSSSSSSSSSTKWPSSRSKSPRSSSKRSYNRQAGSKGPKGSSSSSTKNPSSGSKGPKGSSKSRTSSPKSSSGPKKEWKKQWGKRKQPKRSKGNIYDGCVKVSPYEPIPPGTWIDLHGCLRHHVPLNPTNPPAPTPTIMPAPIATRNPTTMPSALMPPASTNEPTLGPTTVPSALIPPAGTTVPTSLAPASPTGAPAGTGEPTAGPTDSNSTSIPTTIPTQVPTPNQTTLIPTPAPSTLTSSPTPEGILVQASLFQVTYFLTDPAQDPTQPQFDEAADITLEHIEQFFNDTFNLNFNTTMTDFVGVQIANNEDGDPAEIGYEIIAVFDEDSEVIPSSGDLDTLIETALLPTVVDSLLAELALLEQANPFSGTTSVEYSKLSEPNGGTISTSEATSSLLLPFIGSFVGALIVASGIIGVVRYRRRKKLDSTPILHDQEVTFDEHSKEPEDTAHSSSHDDDDSNSNGSMSENTACSHMLDADADEQSIFGPSSWEMSGSEKSYDGL